MKLNVLVIRAGRDRSVLLQRTRVRRTIIQERSPAVVIEIPAEHDDGGDKGARRSAWHGNQDQDRKPPAPASAATARRRRSRRTTFWVEDRIQDDWS